MSRQLLVLLSLTVPLSCVWADNKGTLTELDGLKSRVPASWKQKETDGQMRRLHFVLPRERGDDYDGEFLVFYFGKGGGGGVEGNLARWKSMMTPPDGKSIDDVSKIEKAKAGTAPVTIVDVKGTYNYKAKPSDATGEKRPDYRLIGIIIESPEGPYYVRITGPAKTIDAHKKGIDAWIKEMK